MGWVLKTSSGICAFLIGIPDLGGEIVMTSRSARDQTFMVLSLVASSYRDGQAWSPRQAGISSDTNRMSWVDT
jgi:hypothetical protein